MTAEVLPVHDRDYVEAWNEEPTITVQVKGYFAPDGTSDMFGRLTHAVDEQGNLWPIIRQDPGRVTRCPRCSRKVYVPDAVAAKAKVACPYRDCLGWLPTVPQFGDVLVDDAPPITLGGICSEHGTACMAPKAGSA